ncbi:RsfA family transcriptional regulator [Bacillus sp. FJAT-42376]|uniref:RsfA family transcriptional regulator n=1 Tax=Bacillus sp. FJAT-42376 TaxID=2014076 RepID=UPI000F4FB35B|nr:RsfA family transcriptional regulator [Bacillus sp. FJAT-42376]AZB42825.1 RsfA family transcriptional regulator [Bacillus sp. FJAT-42376]
MTATRQDAWTQDEDLLLAEVVLRHIREGGTQLAAFEEVGRHLTRTAAACGFRWNSYVRKQYKSGIDLAKKHRKESRAKIEVIKEETEGTRLPAEDKKGLTIKEIVKFLEAYDDSEDVKSLKKNNDELIVKVENLTHQVMVLEKEKQILQNQLQLVEEDYQSLIEIMDRARKMAISQEDERNRKVKFQMDRNGNLERVEK